MKNLLFADPLDDWLDTRVDLLDLLVDEEIVGREWLEDAPILQGSQCGLEALKSVALEPTLELGGEAQPDSPVPKPSQLEDNPYTTGMGLIELLTSSVDLASFNNVAQSMDLDVVNPGSPSLAPMSPEDIESILSSEPTSPLASDESFESLFSTVSSDSSFDLSVLDDSENLPADLVRLSEMVSSEDQSVTMDDLSEIKVSPGESSSSDVDGTHVKYHVDKSRTTPYARNVKKEQKSPQEKLLDRKLRKKQQNKDAATRYRQKKKAEMDLNHTEVETLENKNIDLRNKVEQMTNEIQYLKNLFADVHKARGIKIKSK